MGRLIIVRHGHTALNCPGDDERLRAWLDVPLDPQGLREAHATAEVVANYSIDAIFCSDLIRARQTAAILHQGAHAPVTPTGDLRPWNLGAFGGQKVREILPFLNLLNENPDMPAPSGESFHQFYVRYSARLLNLLDLADASPNNILAVTHVRNLLAAPSIIHGTSRDRIPVRGGPSTGEISIADKIDGRWRIRREDGTPVVQELQSSPEPLLGKDQPQSLREPSTSDLAYSEASQ